MALTAVPLAAQSTMDRFGCSLAFVRLHWGEHLCIDGIRYTARCLFVDPEREAECLGLMIAPPKTNREAN